MTGKDQQHASADETLELPRKGPIAPPDEQPPNRIVPSPPSIHRAHRRPFDLGPMSLLAALVGVALLLSIILFATGNWVAALLFLCISVASFALLPVAVKRERDSEGAQVALTAVERARSRRDLVATAVRVWSRTGLELLRLKRRRQRLRSALRGSLQPLGEAVYREDEERAQALKATATELEHELEETDRRTAAIVAAARRRVERERTATQATESFPVARAERSTDVAVRSRRPRS